METTIRGKGVDKKPIMTFLFDIKTLKNVKKYMFLKHNLDDSIEMDERNFSLWIDFLRYSSFREVAEKYKMSYGNVKRLIHRYNRDLYRILLNAKLID